MGQEFVEDVNPQGSGYPQGYVDPQGNEKPKGSGLSIAALILGLLSMLCCCMGFPFAIVGIILAIIALVKKQRAKPAAIIGFILSIICIIISVFTISKMIPYKNEIVDFAENMDQYIEEYDESGDIPPLMKKIQEDSNMSDEEIKSLMDSMSKSYNQAKEQSEGSSGSKLSSTAD